MARYINDFSASKSIQEVNCIIESFMKKEHFKSVDLKGEIVWKKGKGLLVAPQFIKTIVSEGKVHLEAWIKFILFPGVCIREAGFVGFMGCIIKRSLKKSVEKLEIALKA